MAEDFSESDLRALFRIDALEAACHLRCGPRAACRANAIRNCDQILDQWLVRHPVASPSPDTIRAR